ncbi:hypothetical protein [Sabulibacter ruber]|uniref:hypothetical protein n=1 Tax=Sabulibacter ruber TaxID=2811901 RepID=UPI001A96E756|nr:hypothetical protein [Sabulibacter ruber]
MRSSPEDFPHPFIGWFCQILLKPPSFYLTERNNAFYGLAAITGKKAGNTDLIKDLFVRLREKFLENLNILDFYLELI